MKKRLAELGRTGITVRSAGVAAFEGMPPTDDTIEVMKEAGIDVSGYTTKVVTEEMVQGANLILAMEPAHKEALFMMAPDAAAKTFLLKEYGIGSQHALRGLVIRDPIGKGITEYRMCRDDIGREIDRIAGIL